MMNSNLLLPVHVYFYVALCGLFAASVFVGDNLSMFHPFQLLLENNILELSLKDWFGKNEFKWLILNMEHYIQIIIFS